MACTPHPLYPYRDPYDAPLIPLEPHNPSWAHEFATAKKMLQNLLAGLPILSIEHVGSTSIPDLIAKPILDIDIVIKEQEFPAVLQRMREGGYYHLGECKLVGRHSFWQPGCEMEYGEPMRWFRVEIPDEKNGGKKWVIARERRRNTYVCFEGSLNLRNHRDVKRILLEDAELRKEYGDIKKLLASYLTLNDMVEYADKKRPMIQKILRRAGWTEEEMVSTTKVKEYRPEQPSQPLLVEKLGEGESERDKLGST